MVTTCIWNDIDRPRLTIAIATTVHGRSSCRYMGTSTRTVLVARGQGSTSLTHTPSLSWSSTEHACRGSKLLRRVHLNMCLLRRPPRARPGYSYASTEHKQSSDHSRDRIGDCEALNRSYCTHLSTIQHSLVTLVSSIDRSMCSCLIALAVPIALAHDLVIVVAVCVAIRQPIRSPTAHQCESAPRRSTTGVQNGWNMSLRRSVDVHLFVEDGRSRGSDVNEKADRGEMVGNGRDLEQEPP